MKSMESEKMKIYDIIVKLLSEKYHYQFLGNFSVKDVVNNLDRIVPYIQFEYTKKRLYQIVYNQLHKLFAAELLLKYKFDRKIWFHKNNLGTKNSILWTNPNRIPFPSEAKT